MVRLRFILSFLLLSDCQKVRCPGTACIQDGLTIVSMRIRHTHVPRGVDILCPAGGWPSLRMFCPSVYNASGEAKVPSKLLCKEMKGT